MPNTCNCQNELDRMVREARKSLLFNNQGKDLQAEIALEKAKNIREQIELCGCPVSDLVAERERFLSSLWKDRDVWM